MSSVRPDGGPSRAARLQPEDRRAQHAEPGTAWTADARFAGVGDALDDLHHGGFSRDEPDAEESAERLARIARDHAHIEELRASGFEGPKYELFKTELA